MSIMNDQVRRTTLPNGEPAPQPFDRPLNIDIVFWLPILYVSISIGSLVFISSYLSLLRLETSACIDETLNWAIFLVSTITTATLLSCAMTCCLCHEAC